MTTVSHQDEAVLTKIPMTCRPYNKDDTYLSVREVVNKYKISTWAIYQYIKYDPTFPYSNVGHKKKFIVNENFFKEWLQRRTEKEKKSKGQLVKARDLLRRVKNELD